MSTNQPVMWNNEDEVVPPFNEEKFLFDKYMRTIFQCGVSIEMIEYALETGDMEFAKKEIEIVKSFVKDVDVLKAMAKHFY